MTRSVGVAGRLGALADPLIAGAAYLAILRIYRVQITTPELVLLLVTLSLTYPGRLSFHERSPGLIAAVLVRWLPALALLLAFGAAIGVLSSFDFRVLATWTVAVPVVLIAVHLAAPRLAARLLRPLRGDKKTVIVGTTAAGLRLGALIEAGEAAGQRVAGYFDDRGTERLYESVAGKITGRIDEVAEFAKQHSINTIYIALPMSAQPRIVSLLDQLKDTTASVHFVPDIFVSDLIQARFGTVAGVPTFAVCESPFYGVSAVSKRLVDLLLVTLSLPLVLPLAAIVALLIRATSRGPAFFGQRRYGLDGLQIMVWKFRTMPVSEDGHTTYRQVTRDADRVTPVGRFLRKTSLDELPQLLNVFKGEMSLVGPRPHAIAVNEQYRKLIPGYMVRHKVKPGITGWAQVNGFRGGDDLPSMRQRVQYDLDYLRHWSLGLDRWILWKTAMMFVRGDSKAF